MSTTNSKHSITGRDGYIMAKALYWALKFSQNQPESFREWSDEADMKAIFKARFPFFAIGFPITDENTLKIIKNAENAGDREIDHDKMISYFTAPDLSDEPEFIEDGDAPAGSVENDEASGRSRISDHDKIRCDRQTITQSTIAAFR